MFSLYGLFFRVGALMFGGGYSGHALLEQKIVKKGLLTQKEFMDIVSLATIVPGPNAIVLATFIGRKYSHSYVGSFLAVLGIVSPSLIMLLILLYFIGTDFSDPYLLKILLGIRIALIIIISKFVLKTFKQITHWVQYLFIVLAIILFNYFILTAISILLIIISLSLILYPLIYKDKKYDIL